MTAYDLIANLKARFENYLPRNTVDMAAAMGGEILTKEEYGELHKLGAAMFGDRRYDRVFIYHYGASSYFSARGFRASLRV
jgi:hypothetical protein